MLYAGWVVFPTIILLIFLVFLLVRRLFVDKRKVFSVLGAVLFVISIAFYFVIPVPFAVQEKEVKQVKNYLTNNKDASNVNMQLWKAFNCGGGYLNGYQYFLFQKAFLRDLNITLEMNSMVAFGNVKEESTGKEKETELCQISFE